MNSGKEHFITLYVYILNIKMVCTIPIQLSVNTHSLKYSKRPKF